MSGATFGSLGEGQAGGGGIKRIVNNSYEN
jgi:hypothetical protein